eukprot:398853_1
MAHLEIGVPIDAFVWDSWHVADIIDVTNGIKVNLYGYGSDTAVINKNDHAKIAPLHQHTTPFIRLKQPPKLAYGTPRPIYFASKSNKMRCLIISPSYTNEYVYKYDIIKNEYLKFAKYPSGFLPSHHLTALSLNDDLLHIIGGENDCFGTLHLDTGNWNILVDNKPNVSNICRAEFKSNTKELYLFDDDTKAFKYNFKSHTISECNNDFNDIHSIQYGRPIFIPCNNTFMIFTTDKILYSDANSMSFKWQLYNHGNTIIPQTNNKNKEFYTIFAFDTLVFIIYLFGDREIQILNLWDNKWFQSNIKYPSIDCESVSIINTFDNYIHVIDTWMIYHFKIN